MEAVDTKIPHLKILKPKVFDDGRGFFMESFNANSFEHAGFSVKFVQDNHSYNKHRHTFRGLHYQLPPKSQTTLVRVVCGEILDFALDIRKGSPTFGKYQEVLLSGTNHLQLLIPKGFAHGFLTLSDNVHILYKMDDYYAPELDRIISCFDPDIGLQLPENLIMAEKDKKAPLLSEAENYFVYGQT